VRRETEKRSESLLKGTTWLARAIQDGAEIFGRAAHCLSGVTLGNTPDSQRPFCWMS
jgi:hypothetical protein